MRKGAPASLSLSLGIALSIVLGARFSLAQSATDPSSGAATPPPAAPSASPSPAPSPSPSASPSPSPSSGDANDPNAAPPPRKEPTAGPPADPLAMSPEVRSRIGSDMVDARPSPDGELHRSFSGYYEESRGDYRFRTLPPLWLEHTRGLPDASHPELQGDLDRESLYGLLYYQRRSPKHRTDVLFPLVWDVQDGGSTTTVVGPVVHREAPGETDNWVAPFFFSGERKSGGYFHSPLLLTTTHTNPHSAFTIVGTYFRDRTERDIDTGVAPFFFSGDNGDIDGARRTYTLIPPLLTYRSWHEADEATTTVVGPLILQHNPKRSIFDVAPLFFHIEGNPGTGGVSESHTTLLPLFHYGYTPDSSLFAIPGYFRRITPSADTMITPLYTEATTRHKGTRLRLLGPVVPLFYDYADRDIDLHAWAIAPLYYQSDSPRGHDFLTPLLGRFETYGVSRTWWVPPSFTITNGIHGFDYDLHPILYFGRTDNASHAVIAPIFWDFANPKGRSTVAFPVYWRFSDSEHGKITQVTQVAANTLYLEKKVSGGSDWSFHLLPLFSYGEDPKGYFWNILFGLAGYKREENRSYVRAFWLPIQVGGPAAAHASAPGTARF